MKYVKSFDILGVDTAQIPCIELQGVPNAATVGAVGLLGIYVTPEGYEIYVCTKVEGAVYTWKSLRDGEDGASVTKSEINDDGELILTLSDGTTLNAGVVKGADGKNGADGAVGEKGADGVSIIDTEVIEGELIITLSDGTEKNVGKVIGQDGVSIVRVELNENLELIVTLSNDTILNLGQVADKQEIANVVLELSPTEEWVFTDENDTVITKKVHAETLSIRVSGTWVLNATLPYLEVSFPSFGSNVTFTSNGNSYNGMKYLLVGGLHYGSDSVYTTDGGWVDEVYRTITFSEPQTISKANYDWLLVNAVKQ